MSDLEAVKDAVTELLAKAYLADTQASANEVVDTVLAALGPLYQDTGKAADAWDGGNRVPAFVMEQLKAEGFLEEVWPNE